MTKRKVAVSAPKAEAWYTPPGFSSSADWDGGRRNVLPVLLARLPVPLGRLRWLGSQESIDGNVWAIQGRIYGDRPQDRYSFIAVGPQVASTSDPCEWPAVVLRGPQATDDTHYTWILQVRLIQTYTDDASATVDLEWAPGRGARRIAPSKNPAAAEHQLDLLAGSWGGRHRQKGSGDFPDELTFRARVEPFVRNALATRGKATRDRVAEELGIDSGHLKRVCHALTGLDWTDFVKTVRG